MGIENQKALYPIGIIAELLDIHPRTLRIYEQEGLIRPARRGGKRFYSNNDLQWLKCLRKLLTDEGDLVLDPFAGSNTTGAVAEELQRRWMAVENVEAYLEASKFRFD